MIGMRRTIRQPGSSLWNRKAVNPLRGSSEVLATRMKCAAPSAPVMNHLRPWTTQLSPCFSAVVSIIAGSEPAPGCGSVMAKAERTSPLTIGCSHLVFWASVPTFSSAVMLPSSGAAQCSATGPKIERLASS